MSTFSLTVKYLSGTTEMFSFPADQVGEGRTPEDFPALFIKDKAVYIELDDRMLVIPTEGVQSFEIMPAPKWRASHTLRDGKRVLGI
jgi:hypothetical protein